MGAVVLAAGPVAADTSYTVRERETLSHVAARTGVRVADLVAVNGLSDPDRVRAGQRLLIPSAAPGTGSTVQYTVKAGDTLSEIAMRSGVSSRLLAEQNGLADRHTIRAGQVLTVPVGSGVAVASSGRYTQLPARIVQNPERLALVPLFEKWAKANGIPVDLLMAVAWQESGWNNAAVSSVGARGIGQIMPTTGTWIATTLIGRPELDSANPEDNIRMSARYLAWLIERMGDERLAIASYYQGQGSVASGPLFSSTEQYIANVQVQRRFFTPS
jgi:N-acetylmuramoyl-L-alanine amidase